MTTFKKFSLWCYSQSTKHRPSNDHWANQPASLSTIKPINHQSYRPLIFFRDFFWRLPEVAYVEIHQPFYSKSWHILVTMNPKHVINFHIWLETSQLLQLLHYFCSFYIIFAPFILIRKGRLVILKKLSTLFGPIPDPFPIKVLDNIWFVIVILIKTYGDAN